MKTVITLFCLAMLPATATAQGGAGARDASRFFDSGLFELQDNYELEGKVASIDAQKKRITIAREDVPSATLAVAPDTRVRIDGDRASLSAIQPGSEIRATFNISRQTPLAIELDVEPPSGLDAGPYDGYYDAYDVDPWDDGYYDGYYDPFG